MHRRDIPIARPCDARWEEMEGDAFRRFCESCQKHVHDLSALDELEARRLLDAARGISLCVQYRTDTDGRLLFHEPSLVPLRRDRRVAVLAAGVASSLAAACTTSVEDETTDASVFDADAGLPFTDDDLSTFGFAGAPAANDTDMPGPDTTAGPVVHVPVPEIADDFFVRRPVVTEPTGGQHDDDAPAHTGSGTPRDHFGVAGDIALPTPTRGRAILGKRVANVSALMGEAIWIPDDSDD